MGQRDSAAPKLLRGIFRHYDQDGDGTVTFEEFYHVAAKLGMVTQPLNNKLPAEEAKLRMLYDKHDESGCGYLGYERFCRQLAGNAMLDQGAPATMPYHQCKELEETVPRGGESGAALRGRIHITESRAAGELMARAHAAEKAAEFARAAGKKGTRLGQDLPEFAHAAALVRQAKAARAKGVGLQTYASYHQQKHDPPVAGYIPAVRQPPSQGSAAQLRLQRDVGGFEHPAGAALADERQLRHRERRQRSRSPPGSPLARDSRKGAVDPNPATRPPLDSRRSVTGIRAGADARAKELAPAVSIARSEKDKVSDTDKVSDKDKVFLAQHAVREARLRQEDMSLAAGRKKVVEQTNAIFNQSAAQRREVRGVLDMAHRQHDAAEASKRQSLDDDSRRRHAAAEQSR